MYSFWKQGQSSSLQGVWTIMIKKETDAHQVEYRSIVCGHQYAQHLILITKLPTKRPRWYTCAERAYIIELTEMRLVVGMK
jgi:hypothetical protein